MFDLGEFLKLGAPIFAATQFIITGLVAFLGNWISGKAKLAASLVLGMLVGGLGLYFVYTPASAAEWYGTVIFGLSCGLSAAGFYDMNKLAARSATKDVAQVAAEAAASAAAEQTTASLAQVASRKRGSF